ncbi:MULTISPECIES: hypothetical protein [Nocardia]|uniref:Uncharacterized protein n=1 Tax=Nocardia sputorum TaxID=2984338 RepID=A0ABN6U7L3_9NOCA|nr:hypothetical protein [Nocardia sputorum]BDT95469.1 hypothetical protein IFM12275_54450 [Nocardia sputorum]BDU01279.1 hypothetical protein IFM12276_43070 [Nocardia sputorum]
MPDVKASTPDRRAVDHEEPVAFTAEIDRHRSLLRPAAQDYRWRVAQRIEHLDPSDQEPWLRQADQLVESLMIDPVRHSDLDLDAYRAIRDGIPVHYDTERRTYVLRRPGQDPLVIRPGLPEHRLGVIARLASRGLRLEQIQVVALTTAQMVAPHEAARRPAHAPQVERGGTTKTSRTGKV